MKLDITFDVEQYPQEEDFALLPEGQYDLMAVASELKANKAGNGSYLSFEFEVVSGTYKSRKLWHLFNWEHPNDKAVNIGKRQFADLCRACGVLKATDTSELHNIPFVASVSIKKGDGGYSDRNEIKRFGRPKEKASTNSTLAEDKITFV